MKKTIIILLTVVSSVALAQAKKAKTTTTKKTTTETTIAAPAAPTTPRGAAPKFTRAYGLAGCGLGSALLGKKGGQIFAATTNGTSWNQTFGISSGTLNCVDSPTSEIAGRMDQFILVNRSQVQGDIARGQGETVAAMSQYMGCSANSSEIGSALKSNYNSIFTSGAQANEVTDEIISTILANPELAKTCQHLG